MDKVQLLRNLERNFRYDLFRIMSHALGELVQFLIEINKNNN